MALCLARLKRRPEFLRVAAARNKWAAPGLVLQARRRGNVKGFSDETAVRVGFTASRKVGNSVARNRARRRLKAVVEQVVSVHAEPGYDLVVIARGQTLTRTFPALISDMTRALKRVGVYRDDVSAQASDASTMALDASTMATKENGIPSS